MALTDLPLDALIQKADSKYSLVVVAAKRARQLVAGAPPLVEPESGKPVSVALAEIFRDQVKYERLPAPPD